MEVAAFELLRSELEADFAALTGSWTRAANFKGELENDRWAILMKAAISEGQLDSRY